MFRVLALTVAFLCMTLATLYLHFGSYPNVNLPFGYYGEFNHVQSALGEISGVRIVDSWSDINFFVGVLLLLAKISDALRSRSLFRFI